MGFEELGLSPTVLRAVEDLGYDEPTPVQRAAIPPILAGNDLMAAAQTGTGKTAAFVLPVLECLPRSLRPARPGALVIVPTRELAQQIGTVLEVVCSHTAHSWAVVVGGVGYEAQRRSLATGCDVLVATPGRLLDLVGSGACNLDGVEVLVLDEADRMLDMGFFPDVLAIVGKLPTRRQTLLFSATLAPAVLAKAHPIMRDPVSVQIAPAGTTAQTVDQYVLHVEAEAKKRTLVEVMRQNGADRVLVFVRNRHRADHLSRILAKKGFSSAALHGGHTQAQRQRTLARFARGEVGVLVATDVLARGIDVADVSYVVNVDVPRECETYVHRIGRTGRAQRRGWALTLCSPSEQRDLRHIEKLIGVCITKWHNRPNHKQAESQDKEI